MSDTGQEAAYYKWGNPAADQRIEHSWNEVAEHFDSKRETIRSTARKYRALHAGEFTEQDAPHLLSIDGVTAEEHLPDEEDVYRRACAEYEQTRKLYDRKAHQTIDFDSGPVAIVEVADLHAGDIGVDYERAFAEAELIRDTPGMYVITVGDMVNNFIIGTLTQARSGTRLSIPDEWALLRRYLKIIAPKWLLAVGGNHDQWTTMLTGNDYFADLVGQIKSRVIYDSDDVLFTVNVGDWAIPCRARHKWRGNSIYNVTHAIERAAKFDGDFIIGFGAHTHTGGYTRDMNVGGSDGIAVQAGTYKRIDGYARRIGFARPNPSTAVSVVIDAEYHSLTGFNNLRACANYMNYVYE